MKTKLFYCLLAILLITPAAFGQKSAVTKKLGEIWNSPDAPGEKNLQVKELKLKESELSLADMYALTYILFQAEQNKEDKMLNLLQKFEALPPTAKKELDVQYPGIVANFEAFALARNLNIYHFQAELVVGTTLKELDMRDKKNTAESAMYIDLMRSYTMEIQRELYDSRNLVIDDHYQKIMNLWISLNQEQKEVLDQAGYVNYWQEQIGLYNHKFTNKSWACTCATKQLSFPTLPDCGRKELALNETEKNLDKATLALMALTKGNLAGMESIGRDPSLATYSGSSENIVRQLVFLHFSVLKGWKMNAGMKISLTKMWDTGETNGSNDYLHRIGLTRETILGLEAYYTCVFGLRGTVSTQEKQVASIPMDQSMIPQPVIKETLKETAVSDDRSSIKILKQVKSRDDILQMRNTWDAAVQAEIGNRENLFLCAETRVVNDSVLELDLKGCGDGKGTFKILEVETPLVGDFFNYCTNVLSDLLVTYRTDVGGTYHVQVIGTADTLRYHDNQGLADKRAEFVKANLGKKLLADCEAQGTKVEPIGLIDQPERKVTIRVMLYRPRQLKL